MQCSSPRAKRRLEQVRRIHRAVGLAGADQRVHLVDEQDDAAVRRRDLVEHGLEPLLELAAIFRAGDQRAHVEREQLLVLETFRHVAIEDAQRQTLDDGGLADAGLADQHRVVLGAAGQHLNGAADFLVAADHRVELAVARRLRQVAGVFLQRVIGVLGRLRIGGAALAQAFDRGVEILRRHAGASEDLARIAVLFERNREQKPFHGDEAVAGLLRDLLGVVEQPGGRRRQIDLAGSAAGHLRHLAERLLDSVQGLPRIAAGAVDQAGRQPFRIVEQDLEDMFRGELLVPFAQSKGLGRLDKTASAVRVFFDIHISLQSEHSLLR